MQRLDNYGRVNLRGIFGECKEKIDQQLRGLPVGVRKGKSINYRVFSEVVRAYFEVVFEFLIKGHCVSLFNKFGLLKIVKTKCIRYNPVSIRFSKDENGKVTREKVKTKQQVGFWYFVFWDCPKIWRQYRISVDNKFKRGYMKKVNEGIDYLDMSLKGYGKNASDTFIHEIK